MSKLNDVAIIKNLTETMKKKVGGAVVEIKKVISVDNYANIIYTVVKTCFVDNIYHAENREIARRYAIIKYFTDIELGECDVNTIFELTQKGNWYGAIESEVTKCPVWAEIELAIDKQIDYIIATRQTAFDKLCADLSAILSVDTKADLADVKEVLRDLTKVDKDEFVDAVIKKNTQKKSAQ